MRTLRLTDENIVEAAETAADVIRGDGVVLYPTDTLYGLGVDAFSDEAVEKIYAIKGRDEGKPMHAIVADLKMVEEYAHVTPMAKRAIEELPRGLVTCILQKHDERSLGIAKNIPTFGFRIPDHDFCTALLREFGAPITATSANASGEVPKLGVPAILKQLGAHADMIDLVIDAGELPPSEPSTVIDLSKDGHPIILREGAVSSADVWDVLKPAN